MNKTKTISVRADEDEMERLKTLAGEMTVSKFLLARAFSVERPLGRPDKYPGWVVVEQGRRDLGIRIQHPSFVEQVMLYPEDAAYNDFV